MTKKDQDCRPLVKPCRHCLLYPAGSDKKHGLSDGLCRECRESLAVNAQTRKRLWKRQLRLFLNYKKESPVLALYSGGTDSTLALYLAKQELKLDTIALMFDFGWSRPAIGGSAEAFLSKCRLPLIKVKIDFKDMFLSAYADLNKAEDKDIAAYPWCKLCGVGEQAFLWWGMENAAELLGIEKVVVGNNFAHFNTPGYVPECSGFKSEAFMKKNLKWLRPTSVLDFRPKVMEINLPLACGYDKRSKMEVLRRSGFSLPEHYFRTPGSECHLAFMLPCARKLFDSAMFEPKASAYREFISGYLTREEWLEELVKSNNFSPEDSRKSMRFIRDSLAGHIPGDGVSITFNRALTEHIPEKERETFRSAFTGRIKERVLWWHYGLGKYLAAVKEAERVIKSDGRNAVYYEILGESYYKLNQYKKAISALKKAVKLDPAKKTLNFRLMQCYSRSGEDKLLEGEIRKSRGL